MYKIFKKPDKKMKHEEQQLKKKKDEIFNFIKELRVMFSKPLNSGS